MQAPDAAVTILHSRDADESILLIRRAEREGDSWSGHWSFPGGRCDPEDGDALDTALRELKEECGVRLGRDALEASLPLRLARRSSLPYLMVAPFVFRVSERPELVLDAREAAGAEWAPLRLLMDRGAHRLRPIPERSANLLYPAVELDGWPLWGFTYRLITSWLGLDPDCHQSLAEAAEAVLAFLVEQGLVVDREFSVQSASLRGAIPVARVLEHFSAPDHFLPGVNSLEVDAAQVRVAGLGWEEYVIQATPHPV